MAILYIAAERLELQNLADRLASGRKLNWPLDFAYEGMLEGQRVILAANGAGPRLASEATDVAMRSTKLDAVVSTGFCGALDPALCVNDIVVGSEILALPAAVRFRTHLPAHSAIVGTVVSQDRIAGTAAEKTALFRHGAIAVEMEAAGVYSSAGRAGVPCFCIKVVSDSAHESFGMDLNRMRSPEGRIIRGKIVASALLRPTWWPELILWKGRAEAAARVLGDFLVSCRILPAGNDVTAR